MADVTIIQLDPATAPLVGTEAIPIVQSGLTLKTTVQDIANLAASVAGTSGTSGEAGTSGTSGGGGGGGTADYAIAQIIGISGNPTATYDFNTLFPTVIFTDRAVSMTMQVLISDGQSGSNTGSYLYNIVRNNSDFPFWNYSSPYSAQNSGVPSPVSFIFSGTEAAPAIQFYIGSGYTASFNMTILTVA